MSTNEKKSFYLNVYRLPSSIAFQNYNLVWFDQIVNYDNLWIGAMGDRNADIKDLTGIIGNALFESFQLFGFLQQTEKNTG